MLQNLVIGVGLLPMFWLAPYIVLRTFQPLFDFHSFAHLIWTGVLAKGESRASDRGRAHTTLRCCAYLLSGDRVSQKSANFDRTTGSDQLARFFAVRIRDLCVGAFAKKVAHQIRL